MHPAAKTLGASQKTYIITAHSSMKERSNLGNIYSPRIYQRPCRKLKLHFLFLHKSPPSIRLNVHFDNEKRVLIKLTNIFLLLLQMERQRERKEIGKGVAGVEREPEWAPYKPKPRLRALRRCRNIELMNSLFSRVKKEQEHGRWWWRRALKGSTTSSPY